MFLLLLSSGMVVEGPLESCWTLWLGSSPTTQMIVNRAMSCPASDPCPRRLLTAGLDSMIGLVPLICALPRPSLDLGREAALAQSSK